MIDRNAHRTDKFYKLEARGGRLEKNWRDGIILVYIERDALRISSELELKLDVQPRLYCNSCGFVVSILLLHVDVHISKGFRSYCILLFAIELRVDAI